MIKNPALSVSGELEQGTMQRTGIASGRLSDTDQLIYIETGIFSQAQLVQLARLMAKGLDSFCDWYKMSTVTTDRYFSGKDKARCLLSFPQPLQEKIPTFHYSISICMISLQLVVA